MNKKLLSLYGLKWNPFAQDLPAEALRTTAAIDSFCWRIEQSLVREGGFAEIAGDSGTGKSVALRILAERLDAIGEMTVGAFQHPQSNVADFYRELGDLFGVPLRPHNRWGGFKALRERWQAHIDSTLVRPVLLADEAQEISPAVLSELRILTSTRFDSRSILTVVFSGDHRLREKFRRPELVPLGSRIRTRLVLEPLPREELVETLRHLTRTAGNAKLMTAELMATLADHCLGNLRALTTMADELLAVAAQREATHLDEKLFLETFAVTRPSKAAKRGAGSRT